MSNVGLTVEQVRKAVAILRSNNVATWVLTEADARWANRIDKAIGLHRRPWKAGDKAYKLAFRLNGDDDDDDETATTTNARRDMNCETTLRWIKARMANRYSQSPRTPDEAATEAEKEFVNIWLAVDANINRVLRGDPLREDY